MSSQLHGRFARLMPASSERSGERPAKMAIAPDKNADEVRKHDKIQGLKAETRLKIAEDNGKNAIFLGNRSVAESKKRSRLCHG